MVYAIISKPLSRYNTLKSSFIGYTRMRAKGARSEVQKAPNGGSCFHCCALILISPDFDARMVFPFPTATGINHLSYSTWRPPLVAGEPKPLMFHALHRSLFSRAQGSADVMQERWSSSF